ncbi:MAG: sensor domain-containing diguanylate cyclase [Mariprofundaceae bacterium]
MPPIDSQADIEQFVELLGDAILMVDESSEIVFANSVCLELFGYSLDQMKQLSLGDLMEGKSRKKHTVFVKKFIQYKLQTLKMMERPVLPCINSNGKLFSARISISSIVVNKKRFGIATIEDFTKVQNQLVTLETETKIDPLTQLYNRRYLDTVIQTGSRPMKTFKKIGVLSLDLNNFKPLNDNHGHQCGDLVLKEIAARMRGALRFNDLIFRTGGDEFLILLNLNDCIECTKELRKVAIKIQKVISKPMKMNIGPVSVGISIGAGVYPEDIDDLSELIKLTDEAMYLSKNNSLPISFVAQLSNTTLSPINLLT